MQGNPLLYLKYRRRSPQGERGLKFAVVQRQPEPELLSLSARRAWIEMGRRVDIPIPPHTVALRKESVD